MDYEIEADAPRTENNYLYCIGIVLNQIIKMQKTQRGRVTSFHASEIPNISINKYIERIGKYVGCSNECYVLLIIYIDRIIKLHTDITLSLLCIHRIIITAVMVAAKFFDDVYYSNEFYAKVGGVTTEEINELEIYFLNLLDFHLYVSSQEYEFYRKYISLSVQKFLLKQKKEKQAVLVKPVKPVKPVKQYNLFNFTAYDPSDIFCKYEKNKINEDIQKMNGMAGNKNKQQQLNKKK